MFLSSTLGLRLKWLASSLLLFSFPHTFREAYPRFSFVLYLPLRRS
nr:MAG TPA: hypothetical protein [Caudoviricetes sp.]